MKLPFVSIIVPTLNEEKYIEPTLKAIRNQNYKGKFEIIVADYNSKDKTRKIAKKYSNRILSVKKSGVAAGRNEGAKNSKGDILIFVDADTIVMPNTLESVIEQFKNKNVVAATCNILPSRSKISDLTLFIAFNNFVRVSLKTRKPQMAGIFIACRREIFEKVNGFNEKIQTLEDFDFAERIGKFGKIKFVDDVFVVTSIRRLKKWGNINGVKKMLQLYLKYLLTHKSWTTKHYKPIR